MLTKIREAMQKRRAGGESGFTLIELLVVMIIIGILAAIAIPIFQNQQKGARDSSTTSDVRNVATNVQSALVKYPDAIYFAVTDAGPVASTSAGPAASAGSVTASDGIITVYVGDSNAIGKYETVEVSASKGTAIAIGAGTDAGAYIIKGANLGGKSYTDASSKFLEYNSALGGLQN